MTQMEIAKLHSLMDEIENYLEAYGDNHGLEQKRKELRATCPCSSCKPIEKEERGECHGERKGLFGRF